MKNPENFAQLCLLEILRKKNDVNPTGIIGLLAALAPQIRRKFQQPYDPNFFDYTKAKSLVREGKIQETCSDDFPHTNSEEEKHIYLLQFALRKENLRKLLTPFLNRGEKILEIGSGKLDSRGESFISSSIRADLASQFSYCDISELVLKQQQTTCPQAKFLQADITRLSEYYPQKEFDVLVGLNILDTLSTADLHATLSECAKVLKNGGRINHFMNLEPYVHAFYQKIMHDESVVIPFVREGSIREALSLSKGVRSPRLTKEEVLFLDYLDTLTGNEQERLWTSVLSTDYSMFVSHLIETMLPFGVLVSPMANYVESVTGALNQAGFIKMNEDDEETVRFLEKAQFPSLEQYAIESGPFGVHTKKDLTLPKGKGIIKIATHALSASNK